MEEKIIYYKDELNDEFSEAQIVPRKIDGSYKYVHKNPLWNLCAFLVQNILSMPIKLLYVKTKFGIKPILPHLKLKVCASCSTSERRKWSRFFLLCK